MSSYMRRSLALLLALVMALGIPAPALAQPVAQGKQIDESGEFSLFNLDSYTCTRHVIFQNQEGEVLSQQYLKEGDKLQPPPTPAGEGFLGWKDSGGFSPDYNTPTPKLTKDEELVYFAQFQNAGIQVYFHDNPAPQYGGGRVIQTKSWIAGGQPVTTGDVLPQTPSGQRFAGWYDNPSFEGLPVTSLANLQADVHLYPKMENGFWLDFHTMEGSIIEPVFYHTGDKTQEPGKEPTRLGYTFDGWYVGSQQTHQDGACPGAKFTFGQELTENTVVHAHWKAKEKAQVNLVYWHQLVSDPVDAAEKMTQQYAYAGTEVLEDQQVGSTIRPSDVIKDKVPEGFHWNGKRNEAVTVISSGDAVVNIYLDRNVYEVKFYENNNAITETGYHTHTYEGSYTKRRTTYYYGGCYPAGSSSYGGYGGAQSGEVNCGGTNGWCVADQPQKTIRALYQANIVNEWPGGSWNVNRGSTRLKQSNLPNMPLGDKNFYGKDSGTDAEAYYFLQALPGEDNDYVFENDGYSFILSHSDNAPQGARVSDDDRYEILGFTHAPDLGTANGASYNGASFYYLRNRYDMEFKHGDSSLFYSGNPTALPTVQLYYQQPGTAAKPTVNPEPYAGIPEGYVFAGWYLDPKCTQEVVWDRPMPAENRVCYAKWAPMVFTVTLDYNDGVTTSDVYKDMEYGKNFPEPAAPKRDGYEFGGWLRINEDGQKEPYKFGAAIVEDVYLQAQWIQSGAYQVSYVDTIQGNVPTDENQYANLAQAQVMAPTAFQKESQYFRAWKDEAGKLYYPGEILQITQDLKLTAVYVDHPTLTLVYHPNGGNGEGAKVEDLVKNQPVKLAGSAPAGTKEHHTFLGWSRDQNATAPEFTAKQTISLDGAVTAETLYAVWEPGKGDLYVGKQVENREVTEQDNPSFTIKVTLSGTGAGGVVGSQVNGTYGNVNFVDGVATFDLQHKGAVRIEGLPAGLHYKVEETTAPGYTVRYTVGNTEVLGQEGEIITGEIQRCRVRNHYAITSTDIPALTGTKTITGHDAPEIRDVPPKGEEGDFYKFDFSVQGGKTGIANQVDTEVSNNNQGQITFGPFEISEPGTYVYTIREKNSQYPGINIDSGYYQVTYKATDNGKGSLDITDPKIERIEPTADGGFQTSQANAITFENKYQPKAASVTPRAAKTITTTNGTSYSLQDKDFTFRLVPKETVDGDPVPLQGITATCDSNGVVVFPPLTYEQSGDYYYTMSEVVPSPGDSGYFSYIGYTDKQVPVHVKIENQNGVLNGTITYDGEDPAPTFANTYTPASAQNVTIQANKEVKNEKGGTFQMQGEEFTFRLTPDGSNPAEDPVKSLPSGVMEVQNDDKGQVAFGNLTYTKAGTYKYQITEVAGQLGGMKYDDLTVNVTLEIGDDGRGQLYQKSLYYNYIDLMQNYNTTEPATFENTYTPVPTQVALSQLTVEKTLTGRDMLPGERFQLNLEPQGDYKEKVNPSTRQAVYIQGGTNGQPVQGQFKDLTIIQPGTYTYLLKETLGGETTGLTYDRTVFRVVIQAEDKGSGQMETTVQIFGSEDEKGENPLEKAQFQNQYSAKAASDVSIAANKVVELPGGGTRTGEDGEFTFRLTPSQENPAEDPVKSLPNGVMEVQNDGQGKVAFGNLTYTKAGTYNYTLTEIPGDDTHFEYSQEQVQVKVEITDNNQGQLVPQVSYTYTDPYTGQRQQNTAAAPTFYNVYKPTLVSYRLEGVNLYKVLEGRDIGNRENFWFVAQITKAPEGAYSGQLPQIWGNATEAKDGQRAPITFAYPQEITLPMEGQYELTVREYEPTTPLGGLTYSKEVFTIQVDVEDQDGTLVAVSTLKNPNAKESSESKDNDSGLFTNTYTPEDAKFDLSSLRVRKVLEGRDLAAGEFQFQVLDEKQQVVASARNAGSADNGKISFTNTLTFDKPGKYTYTIKEVDDGKNYLTYDDTTFTLEINVNDNGLGQLIAQGSITNANVQEEANGIFVQVAQFQNQYNILTYATKEVTGTKAVAGTGAQLQKGQFSFRISGSKEDDENVGKADETVTNGDGGTISFPTLTMTEPGTYQYVIQEVTTPILPGWQMDQTQYQLTIKVEDNGQGVLEIESETLVRIVGDNPVPANSILFTNTYAPTAADPVTVEAQKVLQHQGHADRKLEEGDFSFTLTPSTQNDKSDPVTGQLTQSNGKPDGTGKATVSFGDLVYKVPGVYTYTLEEVLPEDYVPGTVVEGITYDTTQVTVTVTVSDNDGDGKLEAQVAYGTEEEQVPVFTNTYAITENLVIEGLTARKTVTGTGAHAKGSYPTFSFQLTQTQGSGKVNTKVNSDKNGDISLPDFTFTQPGTYVYTLQELDPPKGYTKDSGVYTLTFAVKDNGNGTMSLDGGAPTITVTRESLPASADSILFTNTYTPAQTDPVTVEAYKVLQRQGNAARKLKAGDFSFTLTPSPQNDQSDPVTGQLTQSNGEPDGYEKATVSFGGLVYKVPGTYTYTLSEVVPGSFQQGTPLDGVTYDTTRVTVTVTVSDTTADGQLNAVVTYQPGAAAETGTPYTFTNGYQVTDAVWNLPEITKTITGVNAPAISDKPRHVTPEVQETYYRFTFRLEGGLAGDPPQQVDLHNDAAGKLDRIPITFRKPGTYTYTLRETTTQLYPGISMDPAVYTYTVTVADNGEGSLVVTDVQLTRTLNNQAVPAEQVQFANTYDVGQAKVTLRARKQVEHLAGGTYTPAAGEFAFRLTRDESNPGDDPFLALLQPGKEALEVTNAQGGAVSFPEMVFRNEGDYTYQMAEIVPDPAAPGMSYDKTVYQVRIHVKLVGQALDAQVTYQAPAGEPSQTRPVFTNQYDPIPAQLTLGTGGNVQAEKTLTGRTLRDDEFTIQAFLDNQSVAEGLVKADGTVSFGEEGTLRLPLDKVGEHRLRLEEKVPVGYNSGRYDKNGITYDRRVFEYVYRVQEDRTQGKLIIDQRTDLIDGQDQQKLSGEDAVKTAKATFHNTYTTTPGTWQLNAVKELTDGKLKKDQFSFQLLDAQQTQVDLVTNDSQGNIRFPELTFQTPGDVTYTLEEVAGEDQTILYDTTRYQIRLSVSDNGQGKLVVTDLTKPETGYRFRNQVKKADLKVYKQVTGNGGQYQKAFPFTVTVTDPEGKPLTGTYGGITYDEQGRFTFRLAHGESQVLPQLPVGTGYTVTEGDNQSYQVTTTNAKGTIPVEGIQAQFTNYRGATYPDAPQTGDPAARLPELTLALSAGALALVLTGNAALGKSKGAGQSKRKR